MRKTLLFLAAFLASFAALWADTEVKFDFTNPESLGYAKPAADQFTELTNGKVLQSGAVVLTNEKNGESTSFFGTVTYKTRFANTEGRIELQILNRSEVSFATNNGQHIKKIVFKGSELKKGKTFDKGGYVVTSDSTAEWNGDDARIALTMASNGSMYLSEAIVTIGEASTVAYPTFSSTDDLLYQGINTPKTITLSTSTEGATLKYRFVGDDNWTDYTADGIEITKTCIVEAKAVLADKESAIVKAAYTVSPVAEVSSMAELGALKQGDMVRIASELTVVFHNFGQTGKTSNIYATNGTDVFNILDGDTFGDGKTLTAQLPQGTVLAAGITGLKHDGGFLNFKPDVRSLIASTLVPTERTATVTPDSMSLTDLATKPEAAYNKFIGLKNVKIKAFVNEKTGKTINNNFTLSDASTHSIRLFNRFALDMVALEEAEYDVEGFMINNGTMDQFYPIRITKSLTSGIQTIKQSTSDAPVYNLAGQRVGSTQKGIVITKGKKTLRK